MSSDCNVPSGTTAIPDAELERLRRIEKAAATLVPYTYAMSYNSSYVGEPPGVFKTAVMEFNRCCECSTRVAAQYREAAEEEIEKAYWEFDARHKGLGSHQGRPQSERDAFKWTVRGLLGLLSVNSLDAAREKA